MDARIRPAGQQAPLPSNDYRAPTYGAPEREAINAIVDKGVQHVCDKIDALHKVLDEIRQDALERNAAIKLQLQDHVVVCVRINDEITHMQDVIAELRAATPSRK